MNSFWNDLVRISAPVALVLEGGGIRGIVLLGHIKKLQSQLGSSIAAYAGTSAGALVAAGIWSGHSASSLSTFIEERSSRKFGLLGSMVGPRDVLQFLGSLIALLAQLFLQLILFIVRSVGSIISAPFSFVRGLVLKAPRGKPILRWPSRWDFRHGVSGRLFEELAGEMILKGLERRGYPRSLLETLFPAKDLRYLSFGEIDEVVAFVKEVQFIDNFDDYRLHEVIAASDGAEPTPSLRRKFSVMTSPDGDKRNNLLDLLFGAPIGNDPYFAPITFSLCDLNAGRPLMAGNLDERFDNVPIASLVRASCGHPFVFRPKRLTIDNEELLLVDGGLTSNFPATVLTKDIQQRIRRSGVPVRFLALRSQPLITVGLSTKETEISSRYMSKTLRLATGGAQALLEHGNAASYPYFRLVQQPVTGEPYFLRFDKVRPAYLKDVLARSEEFFSGQNFGNNGSFREDEQSAIEIAMQQAASFVRKLENAELVRAHLYLPDGEHIGAMNKKALVCLGCEADEQADRTQTLRSGTGIVAATMQTRSPLFCRYRELQELRRSNPEKPALGLLAKDVASIRQDLNFCFSFPIYDPHSVEFTPGRLMAVMDAFGEDTVREFEDGLDGSVLGVLTIDGTSAFGELGWEEVLELFEDRGVLEHIQRRTFEIGYQISMSLKRVVEGGN